MNMMKSEMQLVDLYIERAKRCEKCPQAVYSYVSMNLYNIRIVENVHA